MNGAGLRTIEVVASFSVESRRSSGTSVPQIRSLHKEVGGTTQRVVRILHHGGWHFGGWSDHVLRPVVAIRLVVLWASARTTSVVASTVLATTLRATTTIFAGGTASRLLASCVGPITISVVALGAGVIPAFVSEVVIAEPVIGFEVLMQVPGFVILHLFRITRSRTDDRSQLFRRRAVHGWGLPSNQLF